MQEIIRQLEEKRAQARLGGGEKRIEAGLKDRFRHHPDVQAALPQLTDDVHAGRIAASVAARRLLDLFH